MEEIILEVNKKFPYLKNPVMIAGFPGIGFVGKVAVDYLIDGLKAIKFATLYSIYFPPQVIINQDGTIRNPQNEFFYYKNKKTDRKAKNDFIIVTGDFQGVTGESQYKISEEIVEIAERFKVKRIFTLGGLGTGTIPQRPKVYGAATDIETVNQLKKFGVEFRPGGGIFGAAGLIIGMGMLRNIKGACLMGETHGELFDAKAGEAVIKKLVQILDIKIDIKAIEKKAAEMNKETEEIKKVIDEQRKQFEQSLKMEEEMKTRPLEYIR